MASSASEIHCLFAGGTVDRAGSLSNGVQRAADAAYVAAALDSDSCRFLLYHGTRPLIAACGSGSGHVHTASLPRLTLAQLESLGVPRVALTSFHDGSSTHVALHNVVLGTEGASAAPVIAVDYSSVEPAVDAAAQRLSASGVELQCGGALCASSDASAVCDAAAVTLHFTDARSLLFGASLTGYTAPLHRSDATAGSDGVEARMALHPDALAWPLPFHDVCLLGLGKSLLTWQARARFCGSCGGRTAARAGGVKMRCTACGDTVYPRTDPIVISLVQSRDGGRILLGRQPVFPPGFYSCLAGYMESGESVEEAVRREVWEETRVRVGSVRYVASQPWPLGRGTFAQVMIGCVAVAEDDERDAINIGEDELSDAQWVPREQVERCMRWYYREPVAAPGAAAAASGRARSPSGPRPPKAAAEGSDGTARDPGIGLRSVPGPFAVAHQLMQAWLRGDAADLLSQTRFSAPKL